MKNLELKHLAPYLPYGLRALYTDNTIDRMEVVNKVFTIDELKNNDQWWVWTQDKEFCAPFTFKGKGFRSNQFKPILRPLSGLTKEIEHNGERFIPIKEVHGFFSKEIATINGMIQFDPKSRNLRLDQMSFICNQFFEWHFDVFGLIESGLAVDINTLSK